MRFSSLAFSALLAASAIPAHAAYITESFTGTVAAIYDSNDNPLPGIPAGADVGGVTLGLPVLFTYTFDPSKLITFQPTATARCGAGSDPQAGCSFTDVNGDRQVLHPGAVTFFNDPASDYTITVGDPSAPLFTFSLATDTYPRLNQSRRYPNGYINPNGIGPYPFVAYDGSPRQVVGLEIDAMDGDTEFYSAPGDALLGYDDYAAYLYPADSDYYFGVVTSLDERIAADRAQGLAAGQIPEPPTWALLLLGVACLSWIARRRLSTASERRSCPPGQKNSMKAFLLLLAVPLAWTDVARADVVQSYDFTFTVTEGAGVPTASLVYDATTDHIDSLLLTYQGVTFDLTTAANAPDSSVSRCGQPTGFQILSGATACTTNQLFFVGQYSPNERNPQGTEIASFFASNSAYQPDVGALYVDNAIAREMPGQFDAVTTGEPVRSEGTFRLVPAVVNTAVAEPASISLFCLGSTVLVATARRRRSRVFGADGAIRSV